MARYTKRGVKRLIMGRSADWVKKFNVDDYVGNRPLIEKLHEEKQIAVTDAYDLEKRLESAKSELQQLKLKIRSLGHIAEEASRKSTLALALSLVSIVLIGLGVSVAIKDPQKWVGWVMIVSGCVIEILAFLSKPRGRND